MKEWIKDLLIFGPASTCSLIPDTAWLAGFITGPLETGSNNVSFPALMIGSITCLCSRRHNILKMTILLMQFTFSAIPVKCHCDVFVFVFAEVEKPSQDSYEISRDSK